MSRYPNTLWKPLPEANRQPLRRGRLFIAHSIVGSAYSAYQYFFNGTSLESHFIVPLAEVAWQLIDTDRTADANYKANRRAISVETGDNGSPDTFEWTDFQVGEIVRLGRLAHELDGVPLKRADRWDGDGFGFHSQFPGFWTNVSGKTCPGRVRKEQWFDLVLPAILGQQAAPPPPPPVQPPPGIMVPPFPLPPGRYFGPRYPLSNPHSVSGYYSHGQDLMVWQRRMAERGWAIAIDGRYDRDDEIVARKFQAEKGLSSDGLIGPATWRAAWVAPVT